MVSFCNAIIPLILGYLLDLLLGDPRWLPHPVRAFGWIIAKGDSLLNKGRFRFVKGAVFTVLCVAMTFVVTMVLIFLLGWLHISLVLLFNTLVVYLCIANKSLIDEGRDVFRALDDSLEAGRKRLSWIVSRNTENLSENQVRIAVFESMSENLSDGVVAPLFFYAIGGTPAMLAFKMASTFDSMVGYKNEHYWWFGKFAARLDDVLNFIPARLTALLIALVSLRKQSFSFIFRYGKQNASPNAGYPEAALAGALDCRFGGPNYYHGERVEKPYIGSNSRTILQEEINRVAAINHLVTIAMVGLIVWINYLILV
jgi:adenosylcobinamide-phosphate synthase